MFDFTDDCFDESNETSCTYDADFCRFPSKFVSGDASDCLARRKIEEIILNILEPLVLVLY